MLFLSGSQLQSRPALLFNMHSKNDSENVKRLHSSFAYNLLVETGKWYNIEINQRICKQCDQYKIEDEFHLIFECPKYSELRINAFSTIEKNEDINLAHDSNVEDLQYFFSQASLYSINIFAAFIKLAFESRQNNNSDFSFIIII